MDLEFLQENIGGAKENKIIVNGLISPLYVIIKQWSWDGQNNFDLNKISIFVGKVSPQIQRELDNFSKNFRSNYSNAQLDKYFGKGFVGTITKLIGGKKGGFAKEESSEITIDDILNTDGSDFLGNLNIEENDKPDIVETEDEVPLLEALSLTTTEPATTEPATTIHEPEVRSQSKQTVPKIGAPVSKLEFIYQSVWTIETPMDLREKIWVHLGIPMFCQHLLTKGASGDIIPLYYNIYNNNKLIRLDIREMLNTSEKYNDIPLINHYYAFRDFFFIQTLDNFESLDKFVSNEAASTLAIDLYDARDFLNKLKNNGGFSVLEKDKNMQQLLYYGFFLLFWPMITEDTFIEYISTKGDIAQMAKVYPELLPKVSDHKIANEKEYQLLNLFYTLTESSTPSELKLISELERNLYVRINKNTILNFAYGDNKMIILSLRNLFDKLVLTDQIVAIKYSTLHENKRIELHKIYKMTKELTLSIPLNSLVVRCTISNTQKHMVANKTRTHVSQDIFDVHFYENGNYLVKCNWGDTSQHTFNEGIKIAATFVNNYLINPINRMKSIVIHQTYNLLPITPSIVNFSNISAEVYYRKNLSQRDLHMLRYIFNDFNEGKLLTTDLSSQDDQYNITYYLWKGNHQQDRDLLHKKYLNIPNTYEYLTRASVNTKWNQIYVHNKSLNISLRQTDIKFTLLGMWDKEFNIAYSYILLAMYMLHSNAVQTNPKYLATFSKDTKESSTAKDDHSIKSLKQIDPALYDFKRYGSNLIYSKICQRPNQPHILTIDEFRALPESEKHKTVKYWNFTTQIETYYYAPNPKYPYINFIIDKHPMNYCIPCAKKTSYERKNNIKHKIYQACMETHLYDKGRKNIVLETRYIMNYGKPIEPGRLCKLPENTLEPLFYESFYENAGFEEECYQLDKYFIYGVAQEWEGIANMGIINTISTVLEISIADFISSTNKKMAAQPSIFSMFLNGHILQEFYDHHQFRDILSKIFLTKTLVDNYWLELNWTKIFADVLFYYFNIIIIVFDDKRTRTDQKKSSQHFNTQAEEVSPGDFVELQINQKLDIILNSTDSTGTQYKYIIVVTKKKIVNPIFIVNPVVYFKSKLINKKIYERSDSAINILERLLLYTKQNNSRSATTTSATTESDNYKLSKEVINIYSYYSTIEAIEEFLKQSKVYKMTSYYINLHNQCYYIELKSAGIDRSKIVYLPVALTNWSPKKGIMANYDPYVYRGKMDIKTLNGFLQHYNRWIMDSNRHMENNQEIAKLGIRIDKWISGSSGRVFGFMFGALNYYFNDISVSIAISVKKAPIWNMPYDIVNINRQLYNKAPIKSDPLTTQISESFYKNHLYQILLLEFTTLLIHEKNFKLRTELKKIIMSYGKDSLNVIFESIMKALNNYFDKFSPAEKGNDDAPTIWLELKLQDYNSILEIINSSIVKFMDKNEIYRIIDQSIYNFDKIALNRFKTMTRGEVKKELVQMAKKITQSGPLPKVSEVPNMLVPCSLTGAYYCRNKKLIIPEKQLGPLLDILAADIQNPMKEKWLFTPIFADNIINFLKFEMRPLESITVELV